MQDYWRGRIWTPMLQLVAWGLEEYESPAVKGALAGLAQQSKAVLMRDWLGFESRDGYSGTGRRWARTAPPQMFNPHFSFRLLLFLLLCLATSQTF